MSSNKNEDTRSQALENNPCNMCRAMGLPVCKGHGGGGGGGDSDSESETAEENDLQKTDTAIPESLHEVFSESTLWQYIDGTDDIYTYDAPLALLSIKLDLGAGSLVFSKHDNLSKEEEQELNKLLDTIENELNDFKAELEAKGMDTQAIQCHRENGCLTIKLPTPGYFDAFVQRLTDKNLLVTDLPQKKHTLESAVTKHQDNPAQEEQQNAATAPNPFDITQGPKPLD